MTGTYDGVLVFGGEDPGTGTDTVRTAVKRYASTQTGLEVRYGADIGIVYEEGDGFFRALTYYRIGGEEHGIEQFPVASEGGVPETGSLALSAYPNPFRERLTVAFELSQAGPVVAEVVDVLGRVVRRRDLGVVPAGRREVALGVEGLPAGVYVVRLAAGEERAVRRVVRVQ